MEKRRTFSYLLGRYVGESVIYCVGEVRVVNVITFSPPTQYHSLATAINPPWLIDNASIVMCGTICGVDLCGKRIIIIFIVTLIYLIYLLYVRVIGDPLSSMVAPDSFPRFSIVAYIVYICDNGIAKDFFVFVG